MAPRRQLTLAVVMCAAAAAVALYAASRTWLVEVSVRPDPLPALSTARSGGSLAALLPALALVGLAGAGGLLATRGRVRSAVGVLLVLAGLGVAVSPVGAASRTGVALGWVVVAMLAGVVVAATGAVAVWRGASWPTMGARYERSGAPAPRSTTTDSDGPAGGPGAVDPSGTAGPRGAVDDGGPGGRLVGGPPKGAVDLAEPAGDSAGDLGGAGLWDALDRGEDPTK